MAAPLPMTNDLLPWAIYYHNRGFCVIPVHPESKKPYIAEWAPYQVQRPTVGQIEEWFAENRYVAIAIVLGAVSGNLAALDFDSEDRYTWFTTTHPDLARTLPTERTGRPGHHVLFRCEPVATKRPKGQKIELLCAGAYVIVTPSPGKRWLAPPNGAIPIVDPAALGLERFGIEIVKIDSTQPCQLPEETEETEEPEENMASESSGSSVSSASSASSGNQRIFDENAQHAIDEAIAATMPPITGERNRCVFAFARRLKGISALRALPAKDLRTTVEQWHARAYATINTKPFDETWADFVHAWKRVKWAHGTGPQFVIAAERATRDTQTPPEAEQYEDPRTQKLVRLCYQLQQLNPGTPFYLGERKAGDFVGLSHTEAGKRLEMLQADGRLAIASAHTKFRATRYVYLAPNGGSP